MLLVLVVIFYVVDNNTFISNDFEVYLMAKSLRRYKIVNYVIVYFFTENYMFSVNM